MTMERINLNLQSKCSLICLLFIGRFRNHDTVMVTGFQTPNTDVSRIPSQWNTNTFGISHAQGEKTFLPTPFLCSSTVTSFTEISLSLQTDSESLNPPPSTSTPKPKPKPWQDEKKDQGETELKSSPKNQLPSFQRAKYISSVLFMDTALPLLSSAIEAQIWKNNKSKWDSFWSSRAVTKSKTETTYQSHAASNTNININTNTNKNTQQSSTTYLSNSDLVAKALENLGPTFVKFGQAAASRPDLIPPPLAASLSTLQDRMEPFDTEIAKHLIQSDLEKKIGEGTITASMISSLVDSLSEEPIAAASVGQVYKGYIEGYGDVAVKVQRPGLKELVQSDADLFLFVAGLLESIPALPLSPTQSKQSNKETKHQQKLIATELVKGVDEFMSRLFEELDYQREADNAKRFANLYSIHGGTEIKSLPSGAGVIVPKIYSEFCTDNVLIMEWIDGSKIVSDDNNINSDLQRDNLALIELGIQCTVSQLLETGVMHADPHGGNLLRVETSKTNTMPGLAYLDFGLLAEVPAQVRDGLVCAVAQLVFARDVEAVASLFGELMLLPDEVLSDPEERKALTSALLTTVDEVLVFPDQPAVDTKADDATMMTATPTKVIPVLQFPKLIDALARLVPRFQFQLPPYFLNNARALGTLEGMARSIDPEFNVLQVVYPYALNRLLRNPSGSPVVFRTLQSLITSPTNLVKTSTDSKDELRKDLYEYNVIDKQKLSKLLHDASILSGISRRKLIWDIVKRRKGQRLVARLCSADIKTRIIRRINRRRKKRFGSDFLKL